MEFSKFILLIQ